MKNGKLKWVCFITAVLYSVIMTVTPIFALQQYENLSDLSLQSKSAILIEPQTGTILYEQNSHEKLPPASVTKVMTLLLIYEAEEEGKFNWDDMVTVSEHAASMGGSQPKKKKDGRKTTACRLKNSTKNY